MSISLLGLWILVSLLCLRRWSNNAETQQAALLPFADDPDAALRLERETGLRCDRLVEVPFEPLKPKHVDHLDA